MLQSVTNLNLSRVLGRQSRLPYSTYSVWHIARFFIHSSVSLVFEHIFCGTNLKDCSRQHISVGFRRWLHPREIVRKKITEVNGTFLDKRK